MAQRHYLQLAGGSTIEVTDRVDLEGWEVTEKAEEGAVGSGTMWLADPAQDLDVDGLRSYFILEDASEATDDVIFGGFVADPDVSRGEQGDTHYDPVARMWQIQLTDRNGYWNRRVMTGTDCKRPSETDQARIAWLFASSEAAWIEDDTTYVISGGGSSMDKVDYRGQYLNQVVDDAAQHTGCNWWVQLQETGTGREDVAWYGKDSRTLYSSDLFLTNDPADMIEADLLDGTSLVWPIADQTKLKRDLSRVYTGVYLRYKSGAAAIYRKNTTSAAVYGRRDHVADYPNVKTKAKAVARATRLLADLDTPDERITTEVVLPKGKATKLRAGMRVRIKVTHFDAYDDQYYWMRVLECSVSPLAAGDRYRLRLVLQASGAVAAGALPYQGDAFAGLQKRSPTGDLPSQAPAEWDNKGQPEPTGWYPQPTVGAMWTFNEAGGKYVSVTTSVAMHVRVELTLGWYMIATEAGAAATMSLLVNGAAVATDTRVKTGTYWTDQFVIDTEIDLAAGDTVSVGLAVTDVGWGWTSGGTNLSHLRIGRGTHIWNDGHVTWVGP